MIKIKLEEVLFIIGCFIIVFTAFGFYLLIKEGRNCAELEGKMIRGECLKKECFLK